MLSLRVEQLMSGDVPASLVFPVLDCAHSLKKIRQHQWILHCRYYRFDRHLRCLRRCHCRCHHHRHQIQFSDIHWS